MNLQKKTWTHGLTLQDFEDHETTNAKVRCLLAAFITGLLCASLAAPLAGMCTSCTASSLHQPAQQALSWP